jgi:hypothetical protein
MGIVNNRIQISPRSITSHHLQMHEARPGRKENVCAAATHVFPNIISHGLSMLCWPSASHASI